MEAFSEAASFWLKCQSEHRLHGSFLACTPAWGFANSSKESASAGKAQMQKIFLCSVAADLQGDGFVLQWAEATSLALLCLL